MKASEPDLMNYVLPQMRPDVRKLAEQFGSDVDAVMMAALVGWLQASEEQQAEAFAQVRRMIQSS